MNPERAALAQAYEQAIYTAELPAGQVEFRIGVRPHGPAPKGSLAIITAWNPGTERPTETENRKANEHLAAALHADGWTFYPASGLSADGTHEEPSFAVPGIEVDTALKLARRFNQAAILYWDGTAVRLLWCDA